MKSGQTKYCEKCNAKMEEKLLFTSYYFECKKCTFAQELSSKMNIPVKRNLEDGRHIGFTPGTDTYNPQPHVYKAPAPGNYHVAVGGSGSGGSGQFKFMRGSTVRVNDPYSPDHNRLGDVLTVRMTANGPSCDVKLRGGPILTFREKDLDDESGSHPAPASSP